MTLLKRIPNHKTLLFSLHESLRFLGDTILNSSQSFVPRPLRQEVLTRNNALPGLVFKIQPGLAGDATAFLPRFLIFTGIPGTLQFLLTLLCRSSLLTILVTGAYFCGGFKLLVPGV